MASSGRLLNFILVAAVRCDHDDPHIVLPLCDTRRHGDVFLLVEYTIDLQWFPEGSDVTVSSRRGLNFVATRSFAIPRDLMAVGAEPRAPVDNVPEIRIPDVL